MSIEQLKNQLQDAKNKVETNTQVLSEKKKALVSCENELVSLKEDVIKCEAKLLDWEITHVLDDGDDLRIAEIAGFTKRMPGTMVKIKDEPIIPYIKAWDLIGY